MKAGAVIVRFLRFVTVSLSALNMSLLLFVDLAELFPLVDEQDEFLLAGYRTAIRVKFV